MRESRPALSGCRAVPLGPSTASSFMRSAGTEGLRALPAQSPLRASSTRPARPATSARHPLWPHGSPDVPGGASRCHCRSAHGSLLSSGPSFWRGITALLKPSRMHPAPIPAVAPLPLCAAGHCLPREAGSQPPRPRALLSRDKAQDKGERRAGPGLLVLTDSHSRCRQAPPPRGLLGALWGAAPGVRARPPGGRDPSGEEKGWWRKSGQGTGESAGVAWGTGLHQSVALSC